MVVLASICSLAFLLPPVRLPVSRPGSTDVVMLFGKGENSKVSSPRDDGGSSMPNPLRSVQNGKDDFQVRPPCTHLLPTCNNGSLLILTQPSSRRHGDKASWADGERARRRCL